MAAPSTLLRNPNVNALIMSPAAPPVGVTVGADSLPVWTLPQRTALPQPARRTHELLMARVAVVLPIADQHSIRSPVVAPVYRAGATVVLLACDAAPAAT